MTEAEVRAVLPAWLGSSRADSLVSVPAESALSGADVWRVATEGGVFALRRWPAGRPRRERLAAIHSYLRHVAKSGVGFVAVPVALRGSGVETWLDDKERLWQLEPWLPGEPVERGCSSAQTLAGCRALAALHRAAATAPGDDDGRRAGMGPAPTFAARIAHCQRLDAAGLSDLLASAALHHDPSQRATAVEAILLVRNSLPRVADLLRDWDRRMLPLSWRHGDARVENFLFTGDAATGLVDFGAAAVDAPVADLVRFLASACGDDRRTWAPAIAAYCESRPLGEAEYDAIGPLHETGLVLTLANWLAWLLPGSEQIPHDRQEAGWKRLEEVLVRLRALEGR